MTYVPTPGARVKLQTDLYCRMRNRPHWSPDEYARAFASSEGRIVESSAKFVGPTGLTYAYNVTLGDGRTYHCPALYADPVVEEVCP